LVEIGFSYLDGEVFIARTPGPRSWLANLIASPEFTFHLNGSIQADLPARATSIFAEDKRWEIFTIIRGTQTQRSTDGRGGVGGE
jgi:hypothetical protein